MKLILTLTMMTVMGFAMQNCSQSDLTAKSDTKTSTTANSSDAAANTNAMKPAPADHSDHSDEAPRINLEDAKKDFDRGKAVFVDTRAEAAFNVEHIKGAINIPAGEFETRYTEVPKDKKIIAYCS